MEDLIQSFQDRLISQVPALKEVDEDWGQCEFYVDRPPVKFPCALIDIQDAQFTDDGDQRSRSWQQLRQHKKSLAIKCGAFRYLNSV